MSPRSGRKPRSRQQRHTDHVAAKVTGVGRQDRVAGDGREHHVAGIHEASGSIASAGLDPILWLISVSGSRSDTPKNERM